MTKELISLNESYVFSPNVQLLAIYGVTDFRAHLYNASFFTITNTFSTNEFKSLSWGLS